jgi:large subunit ribosomal protein L35
VASARQGAVLSRAPWWRAHRVDGEHVMPKMKTHKGAAKRFKLTGSGKATHLKPHGKMTRVSKRVHFDTGHMQVAAKGDQKMIKRLLGK